MKIQIEHLAPDSLCAAIDVEALKRNLSLVEYAELCDEESGSVDWYTLVERHGLKHLHDEPWIRVYFAERVREIMASTILAILYSNPEEFEGISVTHLDKYLIVVGSVAGGQGGGAAIYDCETDEWVFSSRDFVIDHLIWVESHGVFISLSVITTYAWLIADLRLIRRSGELAHINFFSCNWLTKESTSTPSVFKDCPNEDVHPIDSDGIAYDSKDDSLEIQLDHFKYRGRWRSSLAELLNAAKFETN